MRKFLLIVLVLVTLSAAAQEAEPTDFMRALALIPDTAATREGAPIISYADYYAGLAARGYLPPPNWALFEMTQLIPLPAALPPAGPRQMLQNLSVGAPEYPQVVGFDFFQIEQGIEIGMPPAQGQVLAGGFDEAAVVAAYSARGYTVEQESDAGLLLCPEAGCDAGTATNLREINPGNPFGGHLGRSEPIFVGDDILLNSPNIEIVQSLIETYTADAPSLADAPEFAAVAAVLADFEYVSAVSAYSPQAFSPLTAEMLNMDAAAFKQFMAGIDAVPLPPFELVAMASATDDEHEYGLALVVYADADAAETAAAALDDRLTTLESLRTRQVYAEIFEDIGTLEPARVITDEASGMSVVVVQVTAERPPNTEVDGRLIWSHRPFQLFERMVIMRDTGWLIPGGAADE